MSLFRIAHHSGAKHDLTVIRRDIPSGRDLSTTSVEAGDVYEFEVSEDVVAIVQQGRARRKDATDAGVNNLAEPRKVEVDQDDDTFDDAELPNADDDSQKTDPAEVASPAEPVQGSTPTGAPEIVPGLDALSSPENAPERLENATEAGQATGESTSGTEGDDTVASGSQGGAETTAGDAGEDTLSGGDAVELRDGSDDEILWIIGELEKDPSVERTAAGTLQVAAINKALEARGLKPISAAKRDELAQM